MSDISEDVSSGEIDATDNIDITDDGGDFQGETDTQVHSAIESLSSMDELSPETWEGLDSAERLGALQNVENQIAGVQDRPAITVTSQDLPDSVYGGYDGESICINQGHLEGGQPVEEMFDTIIHEGRHAYQDFAIENPGFVDDNSLVNSWAENKDNYLSAEEYGQETYQSQPLETDAWNYAESIKNGVYENKE